MILPMMPSRLEFRDYLMAAYSDKELVNLCFYYFRDVDDNFTRGIPLLSANCPRVAGKR